MRPDVAYEFSSLETICTMLAEVFTARGTANARIDNHRVELNDNPVTHDTTVSRPHHGDVAHRSCRRARKAA